MAQTVNFQTTNPAEFPDRLTELQIAVQLDEANALAFAEYTAAGVIALGGVAVLKAGGTSAIAMTLPNPLAGAHPIQSAQTGEEIQIIAYRHIRIEGDGFGHVADVLTPFQ